VSAFAAPTADPSLLAEIIRLGAARTGMRVDAVRTEGVLRLVQARLAAGQSQADILGALHAGDDDLIASLHAAITVRETYFFRQPEQFDLVAHLNLPAGGRGVRAWSAACATGEEAYSLAAALRAGGHRDAYVLGTDLVESNVATARAGVYGARSVRVSGPLLFPVFQKSAPQDKGAFVVDEGLRAMTSFAVHNLLDPPPEGDFDVIFCRNALLYFQPDAARRACENLVRALGPEGLLVFAPLDLAAAPGGLASVGAEGAQVFTRRESIRKIRLQVDSGRHRVSAPRLEVASGARASLRPAASVRAPGPVAMHLTVLECLDRGDLAAGRAALDTLERVAPRYLPGMMERALWHRRRGEHGRCRAVLVDVWNLARSLDPESVVDGPEPLPAGFYATSARTMLDGKNT
jgi:chemotaxis protein methyltransferase CheR